MKGQVLRVIAGFYDIDVDGKEYRVRASGNLRNNNLSPLVGDFVEFEPNGFVQKILPRKNELIRPRVANVDQVAVVMSIKEPDFSSFLLNKFLAIIEFSKIKPIILLTKVDLLSSSIKQEIENEGYEVFEINNNKPLPKDLKKSLENKMTVFMGQTGVGKSSTIESITGQKREVQEISKSLGRGKHTTRVVEFVPWDFGKIIDAPGFSSFELNLKKEELARSFASFNKLAQTCKFKNCLHSNENDCAVKLAVENNEISKQKYEDYLRLLKEGK